MSFGVKLAIVGLHGEANDEEQQPSPLWCTSYGKSLEFDRSENSWKVQTLRHHHYFHLFPKMIMKNFER